MNTFELPEGIVDIINNMYRTYGYVEYDIEELSDNNKIIYATPEKIYMTKYNYRMRRVYLRYYALNIDLFDTYKGYENWII